MPWDKSLRSCSLPRCGKPYKPKTLWQKYCCKEHKNEGHILDYAVKIIERNKK